MQDSESRNLREELKHLEAAKGFRVWSVEVNPAIFRDLGAKGLTSFVCKV